MSCTGSNDPISLTGHSRDSGLGDTALSVRSPDVLWLLRNCKFCGIPRLLSRKGSSISLDPVTLLRMRESLGGPGLSLQTLKSCTQLGCSPAHSQTAAWLQTACCSLPTALKPSLPQALFSFHCCCVSVTYRILCFSSCSSTQRSAWEPEWLVWKISSLTHFSPPWIGQS